jgi:hypothetical protein
MSLPLDKPCQTVPEILSAFIRCALIRSGTYIEVGTYLVPEVENKKRKKREKENSGHLPKYIVGLTLH